MNNGVLKTNQQLLYDLLWFVPEGLREEAVIWLSYLIWLFLLLGIGWIILRFWLFQKILKLISKIFDKITFFVKRWIKFLIIKIFDWDIEEEFLNWVDQVSRSFWYSLYIFLLFNIFGGASLGFLAKIVNSLLLVVIFYEVIQLALKVTIYFLQKYIFTKKDKDTKTTFKLLVFFLKITYWALGLFFLLTNLGIQITPLLAWFGIAWLAISFAFQNILEDIFAFFSIYFDKPFRIGDYVSFDWESWTIKNVGIKSTRIQTLTGDELVVPNKWLTWANVHNFGKLKERRVAFSFWVIYETPLKKLKKIKKLVSKIFEEKEIKSMVRFDRIYFTQLGDFSLNWEVVYYVLSPEYEDYLKVQEYINFRLMEIFAQEGIEFAYPTQVVYVNQVNKMEVS